MSQNQRKYDIISLYVITINNSKVIVVTDFRKFLSIDAHISFKL